MSYSMNLGREQNQRGDLKHQQLMMSSPRMQQAIRVLQAPVLEIGAIIQEEIERNPLLEYDDENETNSLQITNSKEFMLSSLVNSPSLFEYLMEQAREAFEGEELAAAEMIIGNLDEKGFFSTSFEELEENRFHEKLLKRVLQKIQTFEPFGIGARNLQESLLIQLRQLGKEKSVAYQIIEKCFDSLLQNRTFEVCKRIHCSVEEMELVKIRDIAHLRLRPGTSFSKTFTPYLVPDVTLEFIDEKIVVYTNDQYIPSIKTNRRYLKQLFDKGSDPKLKRYLQRKLLGAKWLFRNITERNQTLERIAEYLGKKQRVFFLNDDGHLKPMKMKDVADELGLHESTIARAVQEKYIQTPQGLLPLKKFFTSSFVDTSGKSVSSNTVKKLLQRMIAREDKQKPLSDAKLSERLREEGIPCARRTIAKYREELKLGNAQQRRKYLGS